ncbi:MAG: nuclease A inhibitor family protein [Saprospiraceae bacterium]|nr:nuclease A inhibitor family protein [Pyrinomonadaceae bacterium]
MNNKTLRTRIANACENVFYMSETDERIEPFFGGHTASVTKDTILEAEGKTGSIQIEEIETASFFERVTKINEWYGEAENENAKRWRELRDLLTENLRDLRIFKTGRIRIDIYIVGIDAEGNLMGVKTKAVET